MKMYICVCKLLSKAQMSVELILEGMCNTALRYSLQNHRHVAEHLLFPALQPHFPHSDSDKFEVSCERSSLPTIERRIKLPQSI